jgi:magnesium chelatase accessory protein
MGPDFDASPDWRRLGPDWPHSRHSRFVSAKHMRWHVQVQGSGPVLLLLHGTGASAHSWHRLVPLLAGSWTLVCPDLPGHGFSSPMQGLSPSVDHMGRAVSALLQQLDLSPVAAIGHSAGAAVAARMALDGLPRAPSAVLGINPAWLPLPGLAGWLFPPVARVAALHPLAAWLFARRSGRLVEGLIAQTGSRLGAEDLGYYRELLACPGHVRGALDMMAAWRLEALARSLPDLVGPVAMVLGGRDRTIPPASQERSIACLPKARVMRVADAGHLVHEEAPREVARAIVEWLR